MLCWSTAMTFAIVGVVAFWVVLSICGIVVGLARHATRLGGQPRRHSFVWWAGFSTVATIVVVVVTAIVAIVSGAVGYGLSYGLCRLASFALSLFGVFIPPTF